MSKEFERCIITGKLRCESALSIGSGTVTKKPPATPEDEPSTCLEICLDAADKPYIPASSLRGLLSGLCAPAFADSYLALFGEARGETGNKGKLRVYDARLVGAWKAPWRTRNSMDPITGTAKDQHLFSFAYVPPSSEFACEFHLDRATAAEVADFLGLLCSLDAATNPLARLGRGGNRAEGRITWIPGEEQALSSARLAAWLLEDGKLLRSCYTEVGVKARQAGVDWTSQSINLGLQIRPTSPLLVDPVRPETRKEDEPHMRVRREQRGGHEVAVIPAASLRGLLRGHCRKILLTLLLDKKAAFGQADAIAERLVGGLFGDTGWRSAVTLEDAIGEDWASHPQMFNAVDRFTGGVAETALYQVEAVVGGVFRAGLRIDPSRLREPGDWWRGLLVLALRDALEGDLALGWGKSKGYGGIAVAVDWPLRGAFLDAWPAVLEQAGPQKVAEWVDALHKVLSQQIESHNAGGCHA